MSTKERLNAILKELQETEPLPQYDTGISQAEYDAFMKRFEAINQLVRDAEVTALVELPVDIFSLVSKIRTAAYALYPRYAEPKKSSDEKGN